MEKIFLVDAYSLIYRFYYAFLRRPMLNAHGLNTSPIFGFTAYIRDIIRRENPHYLGVAFDAKGPTFRHQLYPEYKANREATPEDIHAAVPYIKRVVEAMRIPILEAEGWEADDIIGTLSVKAPKDGYEVYMVTPDKDFAQLVQPHVFIYKQLTGGEGVEVIGMDQLKESFGVDDPKHVIDILALWGDASDNIPGVPGIGEVRATRLVEEFGTVENILANTNKLSGKQKENIIASSDQLKLSKVLATIDVNAPVEFNPTKLKLEEPNVEELVEVFQELGFNMFIRELEGGTFLTPLANKQSEGQKKEASGSGKKATGEVTQGSLFDTGGAANVAPSATKVQEVQNDLFTSQGIETVDSGKVDYKTVTELDELKELVKNLSRAKELCFDTETTGFDVFNDKLVGISFAVKAKEAWYIPVNRDNQSKVVEIVKPLFENKEIAKIGQNIKFDIMVLANVGIDVAGFKYDTMLLHYLIDPESRHGVNFMARTYLNYEMVEIESLIGKGARQITMDMVPVEKVSQYACEDADITLRLKEVLWTELVSQEMVDLYKDIEEPMIDVLAEIELTGVKLDTTILTKSGEELNAELEKYERKIREIAEEPEMNVNSSVQLGEALFDKLKIDPNPKLTRTKRYRTDEEYLLSLSDRNPIIGYVLEYRGIKKLLSTYIEALPELINPKTGRVHTSYNQAVTATGRLSSSNPNLQNIPVRTAEGREIRRAFVPSSSDNLIFAADYSQVELRLMAHLSEDENLLQAFHRGEDIHSSTASLLFHLPIEEVTSDHRRKAKTANFGIIYGISPFGLGQRLNIPLMEAREIIEGYFRSYPGVKSYMDRVIEEAGETGYVSTIFGRKRWLRDITSRNAHARGLAERNAINAPIQGSAADIMKIAMIDVREEFIRQGIRSKVIMQVHDELVVDMLKTEQEKVVEIVVKAMRSAANLKVDLLVDYSIGDNWLEAN